MKKTSPFKKQNTTFMFALALTALNAAEQTGPFKARHQDPIVSSAEGLTERTLTKDEFINRLTQGMEPPQKSRFIEALEEVNPDRYTEAFINTVNKLSEGMDARSKKIVIETLGKINPKCYVHYFIVTVNILSKGMDVNNKSIVIEALSHSDDHEDLYRNIIYTFNILSKGIDDVYDKLRIIRGLRYVNGSNYKDFIETVNNLSKGMNGHSKSIVIEALENVDPHQYKNFIYAANNLFVKMDYSFFDYSFKASFIKALAKLGSVKFYDYENLIHATNQLSYGVDDRDKEKIILELAMVKPAHYRNFINTINQLSVGMGNHHKKDLISALGKVNPDHYTEVFAKTVNQLSVGMDNIHKAGFISALGKVNPDRYTEVFANTVNKISIENVDFGMGRNKESVIVALGKVNPDHYTEIFANTVNQLSVGMDIVYKERVIEELGKVNPDRYTKTFIDAYNQLSKKIHVYNRPKVLTELENVDPNRYTDFINTVDELSYSESSDDKLSFIKVLSNVKPDLYPFLENLKEQNPEYFSYVPVSKLVDNINRNMTQESLQNLLQRLHGEYYHRAPAGTPKRLVF